MYTLNRRDLDVVMTIIQDTQHFQEKWPIPQVVQAQLNQYL